MATPSDKLDSFEGRVQVGALVSLLDQLGYPNPEDPDDDWGPLGPYIRGLVDLRRIGLEGFGPQPEPWRRGPLPDPWRRAKALLPEWRTLVGPFPEPPPEPWRGVLLAGGAIDRFVTLAQFAEITEDEKAFEGIRGQLMDVLDDWCATPPRRPKWPLPWPRPNWGEEGFEIGPVGLIVAGAQFYRAAEALGKTTLAATFAEASNRLIQTGFDRLSSDPMPG